jgi:hypothetical protein
MRKLLPFALFCLPLFTVSGFAQSRSEIDRLVYQRLREIKPKNTRTAKYSILMPKAGSPLPENLDLNIVYKIGHYAWEIGALRFGLSSKEDTVAITKLTHNSVLPFYREWTDRKEEFHVQRATIPKADFYRLLVTALMFYDADIARTPVEFMGCGSSGDGTLMFEVSGSFVGKDRDRWTRQGNGNIVGDITGRTKCGYDEVRDTLFWEVFDEYLKANVTFTNAERSEVEDLLIARLSDNPIADNYKDYFRRSLLVDLLGEFGTSKSIPALERAGEAKLEGNWQKYLREDVENSTRKIQQRARE